MRYEFHPEALAEYDAAAHYYAQQQAGLDLRFVASVEPAINHILEAPTRWRVIDEDVRRCLRAFSRTASSTRLSQITSLFWPSCTAAASLDTGNIEPHRRLTSFRSSRQKDYREKRGSQKLGARSWESGTTDHRLLTTDH